MPEQDSPDRRMIFFEYVFNYDSKAIQFFKRISTLYKETMMQAFDRRLWMVLVVIGLVLVGMSFGSPVSAQDATPAPTEEPMEEPTALPTEEPMEEPTAVPTEEPMEEPTALPTEEPMEEPTAVPTEEPMEEPTAAPTEEPMEEPTAAPTEEPMEEPTVAPTEEPLPEPDELPVTGGGNNTATTLFVLGLAALLAGAYAFFTRRQAAA